MYRALVCAVLLAAFANSGHAATEVKLHLKPVHFSGIENFTQLLRLNGNKPDTVNRSLFRLSYSNESPANPIVVEVDAKGAKNGTRMPVNADMLSAVGFDAANDVFAVPSQDGYFTLIRNGIEVGNQVARLDASGHGVIGQITATHTYLLTPLQKLFGYGPTVHINESLDRLFIGRTIEGNPSFPEAGQNTVQLIPMQIADLPEGHPIRLLAVKKQVEWNTAFEKHLQSLKLGDNDRAVGKAAVIAKSILWNRQRPHTPDDWVILARNLLDQMAAERGISLGQHPQIITPKNIGRIGGEAVATANKLRNAYLSDDREPFETDVAELIGFADQYVRVQWQKRGNFNGAINLDLFFNGKTKEIVGFFTEISDPR